MANFFQAYSLTLHAEGGYVNDPDDPGGETYKGIARSRNPQWQGWELIDVQPPGAHFESNLNHNTQLQAAVQDLYKVNYWDKIQGDEIYSQKIAESIFDFAVNSGPPTSLKLAQKSVGAAADGIVGPETLGKLNAAEPDNFLAKFALSKIEHYIAICENRPESRKYFFGWVKRTLASG